MFAQSELCRYQLAIWCDFHVCNHNCLGCEYFNFVHLSEIDMIARIWNGWTSIQDAVKLESILTKEIIPEFEKDLPTGFRGLQLMTAEEGDEIKFTTIMYFDSLDIVRAFAGENYTASHIDPKVRPLLIHYDLTAQHSLIKYQRIV